MRWADRQRLAKISIICILSVPAMLFFAGITAKPIGYRYANGYEITNLGYEPDDTVPFYGPLVEAARALFGYALLVGFFSSVGIYIKYVREPDKWE